MIRNVSFLWDTIGFDSATLTASAAVDGWPVANLQHPQPVKAWKCPNGTGAVDIVCDNPEMVTALALVGHNLGVDSRVIVRGYESALGSEIFNEEFEVILPVYSAGELPPCNSSPLGYPSDDDLAVLPRTTAVFFLRESLCQHKYRIEFDNGDKPFSIGRMILAKHFSPEKNVAYGWKGTPADESRSEDSLGGQTYTDMRKRRYKYSFSLNYLTEKEAFGPLLKMHYHCGTSRPLVLCIDPDDQFMRQYTSVYGTLQTVPEPVCVRGGAYPFSANYMVREML